MIEHKYIRQNGIIGIDKLKETEITLIGCGSIGSFTALSLAKMGIGSILGFDPDRVEEHNIPNQFFDTTALSGYKAIELESIIKDFAPDCIYKGVVRSFTLSDKDALKPISIVATDSLASRALVYRAFMTNPKTKYLIDARMGGEMLRVFVINKTDNSATLDYYNETLEAKPVELKCSERTIIYCVQMASAMICRAVKAIIKDEEFPFEIILALKTMDFVKTMRGDL